MQKLKKYSVELKLKAEMKILEAKNRQLEIENEFIKKL